MASAESPGVRTDGTGRAGSAEPGAVTFTPTGQLALDLAFDPDSLFQLRSTVAAHGAELGLMEPVLSDLVLIAHELASNAIRHGGASADRPARLRLWTEDDVVVCAVSDQGPGLAEADQVGRVPAPPGSLGGRGLWIIRQVVRELRVENGPVGTTIVAVLATQPDGPAEHEASRHEASRHEASQHSASRHDGPALPGDDGGLA
jgi:anti-sigma regulatory factor (Ser/Thr protein kinase)